MKPLGYTHRDVLPCIPPTCLVTELQQEVYRVRSQAGHQHQQDTGKIISLQTCIKLQKETIGDTVLDAL